jgi:ankyrin repeat protein
MLFDAIQTGDTAKVKQLLDGALDPNTEYKGTKPLWQAVFENNTEIAQLLISRGADVNQRFHCTLDLVAPRDERGTDIAEKFSGTVEEIAYNAARGSGPVPINATMLWRATRLRNKEMVALLLSNYADVNATSENVFETSRVETVLHCAVDGSHRAIDFSIVNLLLHHGANITARISRSHRSPAIEYSTIHWDRMVQPSLLSTPLHLAVKSQHAPSVELLLDRSAKADPKAHLVDSNLGSLLWGTLISKL